MNRTICTVLTAAWSLSATYAQLGHTNIDGVRIEVHSIYQFGDTRHLDCSVGIAFQGEKVAHASSMSKIRLLRAVDDTGMDLRRNDRQGAQLTSMPVLPNPAGFCQYQSIHLRSPAGGARTIRLLEAEVDLQWLLTLDAPTTTKRLRVLEGVAELCFPNLSNGGILEFGGFLNRPGERISDSALNTSGVTLVFTGQDNFETRKKAWRQSQRGTILNARQPLARSGNTQDSLQFSIRDPEQRIIRLEFLDAKGAVLPVVADMTCYEPLAWPAEYCQLYAFEIPPPEGTRFKVYLASPESVQCVPFHLKDIAL